MSKITCNKCGEKIKIKTIFLERAGCENCGNSIDFVNMDSLSGLRQGLMLLTAVVVGIVFFLVMVFYDINLNDLPTLVQSMSMEALGVLVFLTCVMALIIGTLERVIGCHIYEKERKFEENLERIAEIKRREDAGLCETNDCPAEQCEPAQTIIVNDNMSQPKQHISILGWIGRSLIPAIPFVGPLIYIIMLFVWAGDEKREETFNNWAKAQLWVMLIVLLITVVVALFAFLMGMIATMSF